MERCKACWSTKLLLGKLVARLLPPFSSNIWVHTRVIKILAVCPGCSYSALEPQAIASLNGLERFAINPKPYALHTIAAEPCLPRLKGWRNLVRLGTCASTLTCTYIYVYIYIELYIYIYTCRDHGLGNIPKTSTSTFEARSAKPRTLNQKH